MNKFKLILIALFTLCGLNQAFAESAESIINKVVSSYNASKSVKANINISSSNGEMNGTIIMQGKCFHISTPSVKSWYNGTIQWTYAKQNGEVNITEPTPEELQTSNPYAAITSFKNNYTGTLVNSKNSVQYDLKFIPKNKNNDIMELHLYIDKRSYNINRIIIKTRDKTTYTTIISNYKTGVNYPQSTFILDKKAIPSGTPIVDLR